MKLLNGIGLGTFPFASPFTKVNESEASNIVTTYLNEGGKYIDTAPTYSFGEVEILLGKILKKFKRDNFFINSSCGFVRQGNGYVKSGRYKDVIQDCEESLLRLGLNEIDLYISHTPDTETGTPFSETISAMEDLKKQGKIKAIGVSNVSLEQLKEYNQSNSVEFVQNRFSLLNQNFDEDFTDYCIDNRIGIVAFQVIERGILTEKFINTNIELSENDLRNKKPEFRKVVRSVVQNWVNDDLLPISIRYDLPLSALAIKWALSNDYIALCQCGATNTKQVLNNLKSIQSSNSDVIDEINASYEKLSDFLEKEYQQTVIEFLGISLKDTLKGSATGK